MKTSAIMVGTETWIDLENINPQDYDESLYVVCGSDIPSDFIKFNKLNPKIWEWLQLDENTQKLWLAYVECYGESPENISSLINSYRGILDEVVSNIIESWKLPADAEMYIDIEKLTKNTEKNYAVSCDNFCFKKT